MTSTLFVYDKKEEVVNENDDFLLWASYNSDNILSSIPSYLEYHSKRLRKKYLAFIYDLGETELKGRRIVEHLGTKDDFSFWWMTTLAEKSPFKSPKIYDCLRLFALEEILIEKKITHLNLRCSDRNLAHAIHSLCQSLNISFSRKLINDKTSKFSIRQLYRWLPHSSKGLIVFIWYVVKRLPLRAVKKQKWYSKDSAIFIFSYFIHLSSSELRKGKFYSHQWEKIPELMKTKGYAINWLHHFLNSSVVPNTKNGIESLKVFNSDTKNNELHAFLDTYLSPKIIFRAFVRLLKFNLISWNLRSVSEYFYPSESHVWLWPVLKDDWLSSIVGSSGSINFLWYELFDAAMKDLPIQNNGFYLCENQGWERAFLHSWRKYGHGKIIGFQHATAPFWHIYYFDDPRTIKSKLNYSMPLPDKLAVNGPLAWHEFISSGYDVEHLLEVEAIRYLNLTGVSNRLHSNTTSPTKKGQVEKNIINIIILGDMIESSIHSLLRLINGAMALLSDGYELTFKPHPGLQVDLSEYSYIYAEQTNDPLEKILDNFDIVISANSTSASIDATLAGLPVIVGLDGSSFNLSPLRGLSNVTFVGTVEEMVSAIKGHKKFRKDVCKQELFWLDIEMPRWNNLLSTIGSEQIKSSIS